MTHRLPSSRTRYRRYKRDLRQRKTEGSRPASAAREKTRKHGHRTFFDLLRAFWALVRSYRGAIIFALVTVSVATCVKLLPPFAVGFTLDSVIGDKPIPAFLSDRVDLPSDRRQLLTWIGIALVVVAAVAIAVSISGRWMATLVTKRVQALVRRRVFDHAARLPLHRIHQLKSGGVASILREDAGGIAELVFSMLYNPWRAIIQLGGTLIVLGIIDWRLLLGSLLVIPAVFITHRTWIARIRPMWRDIRAARQHMDSHATEAFGGMRVVRSFGRQRTEASRFIHNNHVMIRQELLAWKWSRTVDVAWSLLIPLASAALIWYGGTTILNDRELLAAGAITAAQALTVGDLVMFLFYLALLLEPLATLAGTATAFQNNLAAFDRVLDLLAEPSEMPPRAGAVTVQPARVEGALTLNDVSFSYPGSDRTVIDRISLDVAAGEMIALVGTSGSGKTTLCNLIARFYDPTDGYIELDGRDLRDIEVDSYRRLLGIVEQDIFLFDGTVAENIGYGRRGAAEPQIIEAARQANAHEFIRELDDGYHTVIGERGVRLSGGQRQRLAIARALLADPRILILDEATSNLDTESERLIQLSLQTLMAGRTSFVIAHRLSTIHHADSIVVLEGGRIVEQGTHDELLSRSGRYERMVLLQLQPAGDAPQEPSTLPAN